MIDDFAKRHLRCSYDGARIVRHDIDCKHRDEHEQRPSEAQKDLGTTSPQEVAGSTPAVASTVGGSRMPPGEWGVGPAVKQVGRKSDHSSSDFPDTAQCVVCLTTGRGREPVCGVCLQIAGDILKTTEYGLSRDATAEEVIAALHTPDVTTFGDDRRPAEATGVLSVPALPINEEDQHIVDGLVAKSTGKARGLRRLDATPVSNEESLRAEIRAICDVLPEGPGLLVDRVRRLVDAVRKLEDSWFEATMELASAKRELESLRRPEAQPGGFEPFQDPYTGETLYRPRPPCGECGGSGTVEEDAAGALGYVVKRPCPACARGCGSKLAILERPSAGRVRIIVKGGADCGKDEQAEVDEAWLRNALRRSEATPHPNTGAGCGDEDGYTAPEVWLSSLAIGLGLPDADPEAIHDAVEALKYEREKYRLKALVYGAVAAEFRKVVQAYADRGEALAKAALEWRYSGKGNGVPEDALREAEALLAFDPKHPAPADPRSAAASPAKCPACFAEKPCSASACEHPGRAAATAPSNEKGKER